MTPWYPGPRMKLGLFLRYLSDDYQISIYQGIAQRARERGVDLVCYQAEGISFGEGHSNPLAFASRLGLDGLLLLSQVAFESNQGVTAARLRPWLPPVPTVSVGAAIPGLVSLTVENRASMRALVDHLIVDHGHRRLLFLGGFRTQTDSRIRERVFRDTVRQYRDRFPDLTAVVDYGLFSEVGAIDTLNRIQHRGPFDVVVAANDYMAMGARKFLRAQEDVRWQNCAVTGFDDIPQAARENPPLTSVHQPLFALGVEAIDVAVRLIAGERVRPAPIPSVLCIRESCGCPGVGGALRAGAGSEVDPRVLAERFEEAQKRTFENEQFVRHGANLAHQMGAAIDLPSVLGALDRFLPHFGVRSFFLFVLPSGEGDWFAPPAPLVYRWGSQVQGPLEGFWERLSADTRAPLSQSLAHLRAGDEPLGLVAYDLESWAHPHLIPTLWHLAHALKRLRTLEDQAHRARRLEATVEERTRDLLQLNSRLREEIELRAATEGEVLRVSENERRRLGLDLHDDICQRMVGISLYVRALERSAPPGGPPLGEIADMIDETLWRTRQYAYANFPAELEREGLDTVLRSLCKTLELQNGCRIAYSSELNRWNPPFESHQALNLYRIVQEALQNAVRHSGATVIEVSIEVSDPGCTLQISDNGRGLSETEVESRGLGLRSMTYRAQQLGGTLSLSTRAGYGTVVSVSVPR